MANEMHFSVELTTPDDIPQTRVAQVLQDILDQVNQIEDANVVIDGDISEIDEASLEMLDILNGLSDEDVDKAIEAAETLEEEDE